MSQSVLFLGATERRAALVDDATFVERYMGGATRSMEVAEVFAYKRSTQPLTEHSAGCMFRNPGADEVPEEVRATFGGTPSAGGLVDRAGVKGLSRGGASISEQHANFVVVKPGATADDILALSDIVADRVADRFGVRLEREVVVWDRNTPESTR